MLSSEREGGGKKEEEEGEKGVLGRILFRWGNGREIESVCVSLEWGGFFP